MSFSSSHSPHRLYEVLEVGKSASSDDIRKAYKTKALRLHPDKNPDNPRALKAFQELNRAYSTLMDDDKRRLYDMTGDVEIAENGGGEENGNDFPFPGMDEMFDLSFLFRNFTTNVHTATATPAATPTPPPPQHPPLKNTETCVFISPRELRDGCVKKVTALMHEGCMSCDSSGIADHSKRVGACPGCQGTGTKFQNVAPFISVQISCGQCGGYGSVLREPTRSTACGVCGGLGTVERKRSIDLTVPAGVPDGKTYTWKRGNSGDLLIKVLYDDNCKIYQIDPRTGNVSMTLPLTLPEVFTGFEKRINVFGDEKIVHSGRGAPPCVGKYHNDREAIDSKDGNKKRKKPHHERYTDPSKPVVIEGGGLPPLADKRWTATAQPRGNFIVNFSVVWPDDDETVSPVARQLRKYSDVTYKILLPEADKKSG